ncbi:asparagine synthase-related protein [Sphingobium sp. AP50]|uniref:asparagine synthase-related protein n=1 Tax=Sphingobium sp. AP50 TaxID=1884369 RepID=UPI0015A6BB6A|nr:asparagine synthetase B family protein [Sphingobium sp. AP50]
MAEGRGAILGVLHGPDARAFDATTGHGEHLAFSDWRAVIRDNWGDYVIVAEGDDPTDAWVARSPMGHLPCYYAEHEGVVIVSNTARLIQATGVPLTIDREAVQRHLLNINARLASTCLHGLKEVEAGHQLCLESGHPVTSSHWRPWRFAGREGQVDELGRAPGLVRERIIDATAKQASGRNHILLGLSGGLDSSILAASMAAADVEFSCFTLVTPDGAGDERRYARLVAEHLGKPLFEIEERCDDIDITHSSAAHLPRPVSRCFAQSGDRIQMELADRIGADAYMSGGGGDNIFCYVHSARPFADRLLETGPGIHAWTTAKDLALLTDSPQWKVMWRGLNRAWARSRDYHWPLERAFLGPEARSVAQSEITHEWMRAPPGELPGKAQHIAWILGVLNHLEGHEREHARPTLWPLLAQPVVETCLSIPSWAWISGGQNRVIARQGFAELLPSEILERRSKGSPDSFVIDLFESNKSRIEAWLCEGWLAGQGLIEVDAISRRCRQPQVHRDTSCWKIFRLVDAESWARCWL